MSSSWKNKMRPIKSDNADSAPLPPSDSARKVNSGPATAQQLQDVEQQMSGFEKGTLWWAKVAVLMSFLAAVFICAQWYEMHTASKDTRTLAEAAKKQADKAETISTSIQQAADEMKTSNAQAKDATEKTLQRSKAILDATVATARLDQRAWLGLLIAHIYPTDGNSKIRTEIEIVNTGKTPAINIRQAGSR
jgi:cell division protein FtsL